MKTTPLYISTGMKTLIFLLLVVIAADDDIKGVTESSFAS